MKAETPSEIRELLHRIDALTPPTPEYPDVGFQLPVDSIRVDPLARQTSRQPLRWWALGAAGGLIAAMLIVFATFGVRDGGDGDPTAPSSSVGMLPTPASTIVPTGFVGAELCAASLAEFKRSLVSNSVPDAAVPTPEVVRDVVYLDIPAQALTVRVLLIGENSGYTCEIPREATLDTVVAGEQFVIDTTREDPRPDEIVIDGDWRWSQDPYGDVGPGSIVLLGRAGRSVAGVELTISDGTTTRGAVNSGWFVVTAEVPRDVSINGERLMWTLADGSQLAARGDLLDSPSDEERCVADPSCMEQRTTELIDQIRNHPEQTVFVDDRVVTDNEITRANESYTGCMRQAGFDVLVSDAGTMIEPFGGESGDTHPDDAAGRDHCIDTYRRPILDLWLLQDAQRRIDSEG